jgi:endonuclease YncB( thermonuclease family)
MIVAPPQRRCRSRRTSWFRRVGRERDRGASSGWLGLRAFDRFAKLAGMRSIPYLALATMSCLAVGGLPRLACAQQAPAPDAVPVPPVATESLPPPPPMIFTGPATALDGMTVQIDDHRLLLFGVATSDLRVPDGLRARMTLDRLIAGRSDVRCTEAPRDEGFRRRAVCLAGDIDLGEALLAEGIAFVDRFETHSPGADADLGARYDAAEASARQSGKGLWAAFVEPPPPSVPPPPTTEERLYRWLEKWQAGIGSLIGAMVIGGFILVAGVCRRRPESPGGAAAATKSGSGIQEN